VNEQRARLLLATLLSAFPYPQPPRGTVLLWGAELGKLADEDAAEDAVHALVATYERWPAISQLRDEYQSAVRRRARELAETHGLPEPPPDPERAKRAREMLERLTLRPADQPDPPRHSDEEIARTYALARRQQAERERRRSELIEPTNEPPPPASRDGNGP
jgi:hypothetical protein